MIQNWKHFLRTLVIVALGFVGSLFALKYVPETYANIQNKHTEKPEITVVDEGLGIVIGDEKPNISDTEWDYISDTSLLKEEEIGGENEQDKPDNSFSYEISDFPELLQMPELPTGCEITALTMVLNYYGFPVDKTEMAIKYLPISNAGIITGSDGKTYGPDLKNYFWGNPFSNGAVCGTGAIVTAAQNYLDDQNSFLVVEDISPAEPEELYSWVHENIPVIVLVTIAMRERGPLNSWLTIQGDPVDFSEDDHGAVLIGYSENEVTIADPLEGIVKYPKESFEASYRSRGNGAVVIY